MGCIRVCDLCGEPIRSASRTFKIRELKFSWFSCIPMQWTEIDCHEECVRKLFEKAKEET